MRIDGTALLAGLLATLTVGALFLFVTTARQRSAEMMRRIRKDLADDVEPARGRVVGLLAAMVRPLVPLARPATHEERLRLARDLGRAGFRGPHAPELYLGGKVVLAIASLGLLFAWSAIRTRPGAPAPILGVVLFAAGFYAPNAWLRTKISERRVAIERGLADTLDLLVTCIEAGMGLDAALQRVTAETKLSSPALASELEQTFLEIQAGIPRVLAFRRLADRTGVPDLKSLAATLGQTEMFGTSVGAALRIQAEGLRLRRTQRAEERAAYVSVKMALPLILCVLPALVIVIAGPAIIRLHDAFTMIGVRH